MKLKGKRILIAKPGLDGHDVGAKVIALALRDAGADVIYTGLRKSPDYIARVAVEEDVHCVGLSILSGSHKELLEQTLEELKKAGAGDIDVFIGGSIPPTDHDILLSRHSPYTIQIRGNRTTFPPPRNCIPYAAIRWHDFGNRPALGRPLGHFSRHPDTPLLSLSPRRRFPRPTPERVFVADHQSSSGFSGTGPSAPPPQPIGT